MIPMNELIDILLRRCNGMFLINGSVRELSWHTVDSDMVEMWVHRPDHMSSPILPYKFTRADICSLIKNQRLVAGSQTCELECSRW